MLDPQTPTSESHLFQLVQQQSPSDWSDRDVAVAVRGLLVRAANNVRKFGDSWAALWPANPVAWEQLREYALYHFEREPQTSGELDGTAHLAELSAAQAAAGVAPMPTPPNLFLVGVRGQKLHVGRVAGGTISKPEALNLAAWLVALADPDYTTFRTLLDTILN